MSNRPLLMIPGPIEVSAEVVRAYSVPPPAHLAGHVIDAFSNALRLMRQVWCAGESAQPFVVAGSGTIAMDIAVSNVVDRGDRIIVVNTGYFSDRIAEMARRRGAEVVEVGAAFGAVADLEAIEAAAQIGAKALLATHVDTSTGVRVDAKALTELAKAHGMLSVFDGVCATAAERFEMETWGADIYLTASQKAIGLPAGLALLVASPDALEARAALASPPPLSLDFEAWLPIMRAYEARQRSYFSTPASNLIGALALSLGTIVDADGDMGATFEKHQRGADGFRAAWSALDLELVPAAREAANTLSAIRLPAGVGPSLVQSVGERGVVVAGGLHPNHRTEYFRVGHMGAVLDSPDDLRRTVRAIGEALAEHGHARDVDAAVEAAERVWWP